MTLDPTPDRSLLPPEDQAELAKLVNVVALSDRTLTLFAIAPESGPDHPIVQAFKTQLLELGDPFQFLPFFYSDNSLFNFLATLDSQAPPEAGRRVILAFGLDQLPTPRIKQEMEQLNLARERIFDHNLILVFWLNRPSSLDEFRSRAPDFWDWRSKVATFETRPPSHPLLYPYLERLIAENSYLKVSGIMQVNRQVDIFLDQIYVSLQAEWVEESSSSRRGPGPSRLGRRRSAQVSTTSLEGPGTVEFEFQEEFSLEMAAEPERPQRITKIVDVAEATQAHDYGVILGDPGAGKTTLLRYLARHFAIALRDNSPTVQGGQQERLGSPRLPILLRIADYAERLAHHPDLTLVEYLRQIYQEWEQALASSAEETLTSLLLTKMAQGTCLFLLDGLDEVFDQDSRIQVVEKINQFVRDYHPNKFVVTSRIAGYQEAALGGQFQEFTITPMADAQIQQFLQRWCLAIETTQRPEAEATLRQRDADREAQGILAAIATQPGVKRFASNPLLLTILALIHRNGTQMPQRRVELYALATKTLIEDWQLGRNVPYGNRQRQLMLVEEEVTALLAPLGFQMHQEKPSGLVTQGEVEAWLTPKMAEIQGVEEAEALDLVRQFLRKVRETTGLFVERAPGVYGFMHLTFEEYFAARYIADNEVDDILRLISPYRHQARWNEPILLALGYLSADQKRVNRLVEQLFSPLIAYQPMITGRGIQLKNAAAADPTLVWYASGAEGAQEAEGLWLDLLFVGQVLAEVKVTPRLCRNYGEKLVLTYLGLEQEYDEPTQQLLRLLRGIEGFNHQGLEQLHQAAEDPTLSEEQHHRARVAMLYIACGRPGELLSHQVASITQQLTPALFNEIRNLVAALGAEMTMALEQGLEDQTLTGNLQRAWKFMIGLSYLRSEHYDRAIAQLQPLIEQESSALDGFILWAIAIAYEKQENYGQSLHYYPQCLEKLLAHPKPDGLSVLWRYWGICHRSHQQYEQSLECLQQALVLAKQVNNQRAEAGVLWNIGRSYQGWSKHEEAITHYDQSRDLYQQLGKEAVVATLWYWLADCYREWGRYEQALAAAQQDLAIRQALKDQPNIADAYYQLGRIYQAWGKYEEAIAHHDQSRDLYQQLGKEADVGNQWYWLAECHREWGRYEQALAAAQQDLAIRQALKDQPNLANAYHQLGRIYQAWGKYEAAIAHYDQSRNLYQQLGKEANVANRWSWLADCYREWGHYEQALAAGQQNLAIRQALKDQPNIADAYYQLGRIYKAWGKYEEAIAHYDQSRDLYQQLGKEADVANQWAWLAACYREWGRYEQAIECQQKCLELRRLEESQSRVALSLYQLGQIYRAWGKYEEAITHYDQSRNLYQQLGKEADVASQWSWLAVCYRDWGHYEQALAAAQQDLAIRQALKEQSSIANAHYQLGRIYQAWGKYEEAIAHYDQSRELYQQLGKEAGVENLWFLLAACYYGWGHYEQALASAQQSLAIQQTLKDQPSIAVAYLLLGHIYQTWGKYEAAISYYEQSRALYQQLGKETDVANQWYNLAACYREWGRYEQALAAAQQDLAMRQALKDQPSIANAYFSLGQIYQAWGKYEAAIAHYDQSRNLYQQLGKETDVANQWFCLAACYREWGHYEQALAAAQQGLAIRQALKDQPNIADAYCSLGRIYQAWGKYEEAIAYYEQSRALYQQLGKETDVANLWFWLADCYQDWGRYEQAIECQQKCLELRRLEESQSRVALSLYQLGRIYQAWGKYEAAISHHEQSWNLYQTLGNNKLIARSLRRLSDSQYKLAKHSAQTEAMTLLPQAEHYLYQALHLDTSGQYLEKLAYDHIVLALISAEYLRWLPPEDAAVSEHLIRFQQSYNISFAQFLALGQVVNQAEQALDIARAYLEINALKDLAQAEALMRQSLQTFQTFNRRKLIAAAHKVLGEIYLRRADGQQPEAVATAKQLLAESLHLYQGLTLTQEAEAVEQLLQNIA